MQGEELKPEEEERYEKYLPGKKKESVYLHCVKAIEKSLNFGEMGLPKICGGDWNDGFNKVGINGKGESVWLGFFLYKILADFIPICEERGDIELAEKYKKVNSDLKKALNTNAWDRKVVQKSFYRQW